MPPVQPAEHELDWPPPENRIDGALWRAEGNLGRREYFAASRALEEIFELVGEEERGLARGLFHLAAVGYKRQCGDDRGAKRQLAHARRRLAPFLPSHREVDLAGLLEAVERDLAS